MTKYKSVSHPFCKPVDVKALGLVDYHDIISKPIWVGFFEIFFYFSENNSMQTSSPI